MGYEARIKGLWYPVEVFDTHETFGLVIYEIEVIPHMIWNGEISRARPFSSNSMGGVVNISRGDVTAENLRKTKDDPLKTIYPKKE